MDVFERQLTRDSEIHSALIAMQNPLMAFGYIQKYIHTELHLNTGRELKSQQGGYSVLGNHTDIMCYTS